MRRRRLLRRTVSLDLPIKEAERFISRTKILLQLINHADEAAAAYSLGEWSIMLDALGRYHALRCEHAEKIDIRLID